MSGHISDVMDKLEYSLTCTRKVRFAETVCGDYAMVRDEDSGDQIEKNEIGGACSMYGGEERCVQGFGGETWGGRDHMEDPGVNGRIILRWIFRKWDVVAWTGSIGFRIGTGGGQL